MRLAGGVSGWSVCLAVAALAAIGARAQEPITQAGLRGTWAVSGSKFEETLEFAGDGELQVATISRFKDGKPSSPIARRSQGAYSLGTNACRLGQEEGNLYIAKERDRCCFLAYMMGRTLVLDRIAAGNAIFIPSLCESKTMTRVGVGVEQRKPAPGGVDFREDPPPQRPARRAGPEQFPR